MIERLVHRVRTAAINPAGGVYRLRHRLDHDGLFERYAALCRRQGLERVWLVLSFDCDTDEDARVVESVHGRLMEIGVCPVYAVPGEVLRQSPDVYGRIAATGAQFINHGNRAHTYFDPRQGHNVSSFFFDSAEPAVVQRDIVAGDRALREILGVETDGFRAPHFGTFQRPRQLRWLHQVLRSELCYRFSTSTVPLWSFRYGAVFERFGLPEVPLTGGVEAPFNILDTWGFFAAPNRSRTAADFEREATLLAETFAGLGVGVINVYGDPSHIHDRDEFFRAVERWQEIAEPSDYGRLLDSLSPATSSITAAMSRPTRLTS